MPYKDKEKSKNYHTEYMKKYREENRERVREINKKSESRPERKEYIKKWWKESPKAKAIRKRYFKSEKGRLYDKEWVKNNPEKVKIKYKKYYDSIKGIVCRLKKADMRRFKISNKNITIELIEMVNARDKSCVYCGKEFLDLNNFMEIQYDHVNPFMPFSKTNMVRCCNFCNQEKSNADVIQWCKFNNFIVTPIIQEFYDISKGIVFTK